MPGSWSDFLKLRSGPAPPPSSEAGAVRVYADSGGALRSVKSDGTDAPIGAGGPWGGSVDAKFSGNGSPVAAVTPDAIGDFYVDVGTPALYQATGLSATNWVAVPHVIQGVDAASRTLTIRTPNDQTSPALIVVNEDEDDCFSVGGSNGVTLSADAVGGTSELQITTAALTFKDETGATAVDIEGGFTNLGPGGEVSIAAGQVFAVLPEGDPGNPGQLYSVAGVVHISL